MFIASSAEMLGVPWEKCDVDMGQHQQEPALDLRLRRQPDHPRHDPGGARRGHGCETEAAGDCREDLGGKPEQYEVANERVFHKGGGTSMTLAQAAQRAIELGGIYDGHEAPEDVNEYTKASIAALAGQGLVAARQGQVPARRPVVFLRRQLC